MTLAGTLQIKPKLTYANSDGVSSQIRQLVTSALLDLTFTDGTDADEIDLLWVDQRTLAASTAEELDLAGSLADAFGATLTFVRIKMIIITSASANGDTISVGGAAANGFVNWVADSTDKLVIRPKGGFCLVAPDATGYAVTAGTGDLLKIENDDSGDTATYDILIAGCSA